jgi:hypothetical protein
MSWEVISPDLTRNESEKHVPGGAPYTNEAAGGEVYNTISYLAVSPHEEGTLYSGSDCGLVYLTRNGGETWKEITPPDLEECLINHIAISPHNPGRAYLTATRYKFNDMSPMVFITSDYGNHWEMIVEGIEEEDFVRVVREDEVVPGLLYAGSESGLYLSYDQGEKWHRTQFNLPRCPVTDLTFQENDLIVATSGRSFWILDDLTPIQEGMNKLGEKVHLFAPRSAPRISTGGGLRPGEMAGSNPPNGILCYYFLPEGADSLQIFLNILSSEGNKIRSYSNQKKKGYVSYPGGPPPPVVLSEDSGVNRLVWNMRHDPLENVTGVYVDGGYSGTWVPPASYLVQLIVESDTMTRSFDILPDPRISASQEEYARQYQLALDLENTVNKVHQGVNDMRRVQDQLSDITRTYEGILPDTLRTLTEDLSALIEQWERHLIQPDQKTQQDVVNFQGKLNSELLYLKRMAESADPAMTAGFYQRFEDVMDQVNEAWDMKEEKINPLITEFNRLFKEASFNPLQMKE